MGNTRYVLDKQLCSTSVNAARKKLQQCYAAFDALLPEEGATAKLTVRALVRNLTPVVKQKTIRLLEDKMRGNSTSRRRLEL